MARGVQVGLLYGYTNVYFIGMQVKVPSICGLVCQVPLAGHHCNPSKPDHYST
jgi:hypothetical protein